MRSATSIVMLAAACLLAVPSPAAASHRERQRELQRLIDQKRDQIAGARAKEAGILRQIQESDLRRVALEREVNGRAAELEDAQGSLSDINERIDAAEDDLEAKTVQLQAALRELEAKRLRLERRMRAMYIDTPTGVLTEVAAVNDLGSIVVAGQYSQSVLDADYAMIQSVKRVKVRLQAQRAQIEERRRGLQAQRLSALKEARRVAMLHAQVKAAENKVQDEIDYRRALLNKVVEERKAYERALASYRSESSDITAFLRGKQKDAQVIAGRGGWLKWPVSGRISSPYGMRTHPIHKMRTMHTGIDIAAPMGAPIRTARDGVVLATGYKGAYGLVVIVDHGNKVATLYAHLSKTFVRAGEKVSNREKIGAVGSTGWSTGPHLHLEVRVNGDPQDPMRWL